jgi:hypothetical protein
MKTRTAILVEVTVAMTMLSCTTPTSTPTSETTQPTYSPFSHSGPGQHADSEAGRAWMKEHAKTGAMSRL